MAKLVKGYVWMFCLLAGEILLLFCIGEVTQRTNYPISLLILKIYFSVASSLSCFNLFCTCFHSCTNFDASS